MASELYVLVVMACVQLADESPRFCAPQQIGNPTNLEVCNRAMFDAVGESIRIKMPIVDVSCARVRSNLK